MGCIWHWTDGISLKDKRWFSLSTILFVLSIRDNWHQAWRYAFTSLKQTESFQPSFGCFHFSLKVLDGFFPLEWTTLTSFAFPPFAPRSLDQWKSFGSLQLQECNKNTAESKKGLCLMRFGDWVAADQKGKRGLFFLLTLLPLPPPSRPPWPLPGLNIGRPSRGTECCLGNIMLECALHFSTPDVSEFSFCVDIATHLSGHWRMGGVEMSDPEFWTVWKKTKQNLRFKKREGNENRTTKRSSSALQSFWMTGCLI